MASAYDPLDNEVYEVTSNGHVLTVNATTGGSLATISLTLDGSILHGDFAVYAPSLGGIAILGFNSSGTVPAVGLMVGSTLTTISNLENHGSPLSALDNLLAFGYDATTGMLAYVVQNSGMTTEEFLECTPSAGVCNSLGTTVVLNLAGTVTGWGLNAAIAPGPGGDLWVVANPSFVSAGTVEPLLCNADTPTNALYGCENAGPSTAVLQAFGSSGEARSLTYDAATGDFLIGGILSNGDVGAVAVNPSTGINAGGTWSWYTVDAGIAASGYGIFSIANDTWNGAIYGAFATSGTSGGVLAFNPTVSVLSASNDTSGAVIATLLPNTVEVPDTICQAYIGSGSSTSPSSPNNIFVGDDVTNDYYVLSPNYAVTFSESGIPSANLPVGWSVVFNGTSQTSTTSSIVFYAANSTLAGLPSGYPYTVDAFTDGSANYVPTLQTQSSPLVVNGAGPSDSVTFSYSYPLSFTEGGLVASTYWAVNLVDGSTSQLLFGNTATITSNPAIAWLTNTSSYTYTIEPIGGYTPGTYTGGPTTISGPPSSVAVTFTVFKWEVVFNETGLPHNNNQHWTVNFTIPGGSLVANTTLTGVNTTFYAPNGTVDYSITAFPGWHQTTPLGYSGAITVAGAPYYAPQLVFVQFTYALTFSETGLPTGGGRMWSVLVNGTPYSAATGSNIVVSPGLANGSYSWVVSNYPGYHIYSGNGYTGTGTINGGQTGSPIAFTFSQFTYAITFSETGLPTGNGQQWVVYVNSTGYIGPTTSGSLTANLPNGTYNYTIRNYPGWHQTSYPYSASGSISGAGFTYVLTFTQFTYAVTFQETGLPSGTWSVKINNTQYFEPTGTAISQSLPNGSYSYQVIDFSGYHQYSITYSGSGTINGASPATYSLSYVQVTYVVEFTEHGLVAGLSFSVTFNGHTGTITTFSNDTTLEWTGYANGTYAYTIANIAGWHQTTVPSYSGNAVVNGGTNSISGSGLGYATTLNWYIVTYTVVFQTSGLPSGTTWFVNFTAGGPAGFTLPTSGPILATSFSFTAGTNGLANYTSGSGYTYTVSAEISTFSYIHTNNVAENAGTATPSSPITLTFTLVTYALAFTEQTIFGSAGWSTVVSGCPSYASANCGTLSSTGAAPTITYQVPNGTAYFYNVTSPNGFAFLYGSPIANATAFSIAGAPRSITANIGELYAVSFHTTGLPVADGWYVNFTVAPSGDTWAPLPASGDVFGHSYAFTPTGNVNGLVNGTYSYKVATDNKDYNTIVNRVVTMTGGTSSPISPISLSFALVLFDVSFLEMGLPTGITWIVTYNGSTETETTPNKAEFSFQNGSYDYFITPIAGYTTYWQGSVTIAGVDQNYTVTFQLFTYPIVFRATSSPAIPNVLAVKWFINTTSTPNYPPGTSQPEPAIDINTTFVGGVATITMMAANGTYTYVVALSLKDWYTTPATGTFTITAAPGAQQNFAYGLYTYSQAWSETGLSGGEVWYVNSTSYLCGLTGVSCNVTGSSSTLTETVVNGSYAYTVQSAAFLFGPSPARGTNVVSGAPTTQSITFTLYTYAAHFTETTLASGESWFVNATTGGIRCSLTGVSCSATGTSSPLTLTLANGTYSFVVTSGGLRDGPSPATGTVVVAGASPSTVTITFTLYTYTVMFTTSGLPSGTVWFVNFTAGGASWFSKPVSGAQSGGSFTFLGASALINGSYTYTVSAESSLFSYAHTATLTVSGGGLSKTLTFTLVTYSLTLTASTLPPGTTWFANVTVVPRYVPPSIPWPVNLTTSASSGSITGLFNGTFTYVVVAESSFFSYQHTYSLTESGGTPSSATITFTVVSYSVSFTTSGLASGTRWLVNVTVDPHYVKNVIPWPVNLTTTSSPGSVTGIVNGTFTYTVVAESSYFSYIHTNTLTESGGTPLSVTLGFILVTYAVAFTETGLPVVAPSTIATWFVNVTAGGPSFLSLPYRSGALTTRTTNFTGTPTNGLPNGTYTYTVSVESNLFSYAHTNSLTESGGAPATVTVAFTLVTYSVTYSTSGLASGIPWSVNVTTDPQYVKTYVPWPTNLTTSSGSGSVTGFVNGSYTYSVVAESSYFSYLHTRTLTEAGGTPSSVTLTFTLVTYTVTFSESGLPVVGANTILSWFVNITAGGPSFLSLPYSSGAITTRETNFTGTPTSGLPNGTYSYHLGAATNYFFYQHTFASALTVAGASPATTPATYSLYTTSLTFSQTTLPGTVGWYVNVTSGGPSWFVGPTSGAILGASHTFSGANGLPNGTFGYTVQTWSKSFVSNTPTGSVTEPGVGTITVIFYELYAVSFQETNLPQGTLWNVSVNTTKIAQTVPSSSPSAITFYLKNTTTWTYNFTIGNVGGYHISFANYSTPWYTGSISVSGHPVYFGTIWGVVTYQASIAETGLVGGILWQATIHTLNGNQSLGQTTPNPIVFSEPNGTYYFNITPIRNYTGLWSGYITVHGGNAQVTVVFTAFTYTVTFTASSTPAIPAGTHWYVNFTSYVAGPPNFAVGAQTNCTVVGNSCAATFSSVGTVTLTIQLANGSYSVKYAVDAKNWYTTPATGTVNVNGATVSVPNVAYVIFFYSVTFLATTSPIIPNGVTWYLNITSTPPGGTVSHNTATFGGAPMDLAGNASITLMIENGTYGYQVGISNHQWYYNPPVGTFLASGPGFTLTFAYGPYKYLAKVTATSSPLIPSGTTWTVTFNTFPAGYNPGTIATTFAANGSAYEYLQLVNGSYTFTVSVGNTIWYTTPAKGSESVAGANPSAQTFAYRLYTYGIEFNATSMAVVPATPVPAGTTWYLNFSAIPSALGFSALTLAFSAVGDANYWLNAVNGTYTYTLQVSNERWWTGGVAGGSFSLTGASYVNGTTPGNQLFVYRPYAYQVFFGASSSAPLVPNGVTWSITWTATPTGIPTYTYTAGFSAGQAQDTINVVNGTYSYTVSISNTDWYTAPAKGTFSVVHANPANQLFTYSPYYYTETFDATSSPSLATGTWYVNFTSTPTGISVSPQSATFASGSASFTLSVVNGTYQYSTAVSNKIWWASPATGSLNVAGSGGTLTINYKPFVYGIEFEASTAAGNLSVPTGVTWYINFTAQPSGVGLTAAVTTSFSSGSAAYWLHAVNGSYAYTVQVSDRDWWTGGIASGSFTVVGTNYVNGTTPGNQPFVYQEWAHRARFTAQAGAGSPALTGTWYINVTAGPLGVPTTPSVGSSFTATFNAGEFASYNLTVINGTYSILTAVSDKIWYPGATPAARSFTITGADVGPFAYSYQQYLTVVTFIEHGLPHSVGTWTVTLSGTPQSQTVPANIVFSVINGSYVYVVTGIAGYQAHLVGSVTATGLPITVQINWTKFSYTMVFNETGLPASFAWIVTFNGTREVEFAGTNVTFQASNSSQNNAPPSYAWAITPIAGYAASSWSGSIVVNGAGVTTLVTFTLQKYGITFTESGLGALPLSTAWGVSINGGPASMSTSATITFSEVNGTYAWKVSAYPGYTTTWQGSVAIAGQATGVSIVFTKYLTTVTFRESGLPGGTSWGVIANGTFYPSVAPLSMINVSLSNGTFAYAFAGISGWHITSGTYSGTVGVSGTPTTVSVVFSAVTYSVVFTESGLPSGTTWYVNLTSGCSVGCSGSSSGTTITFAQANGTVGYAVGRLNGWTESTLTYNGTVSVSGGGVNVRTIVWRLFTVGVTFSESGLPGGATWGVTINGTTYTSLASASTTIGVSLVNGSYPYTISDVPRYHQTTIPSYAGTAVLAGVPVSVSTLVFSLVTYTLTFSEKGISAAKLATWGVTVNGTIYSATVPSNIVVTLTNGTYSYAIGATPGYRQATLPYTGTITVAGLSISEAQLVYTAFTYTVTFSESGLPSTFQWTVNVNGTPQSGAAGSSIVFNEANGSFSYAIGNVPGWRQATLAYAGTLGVSGAAVTEPTLVFTNVTYVITFSETGLPLGSQWAVSVNNTLAIALAGVSISFNETNGTYAYSIAGISGYQQTTLPYAGTVLVNGFNVGLSNLVFTQVTYTLTFTETGLTSGVQWWVNLTSGCSTGCSGTSVGSTITFTQANGTYGYTIGRVAGWQQKTLPATGSFTVAGQNYFAPTLVFGRYLVGVTFSESGVPLSASWGVKVNGTLYTEAGTTTSFTVNLASNATYAYAVSDVAGFHQYTIAYSGSVSVGAALVSEPTMVFTPFTWTITFTESGIPQSAVTTWSLTVNGTTYSAALNSPITVPERNGSYAYAITNVPGYRQYVLPYTGGSILVAGSAIAEPTLVFSAFTYTVTIAETGLPVSQAWNVVVNGTAYSITGPTPLVISLPNGSYSYTVHDVAGWHQYTLPYAGTLRVGGAAVVVPTLVFVRVTYTVTFQETGLPLSLVWAVLVNGSLLTANAGVAITSQALPNGTFSYQIAGVSGWTQSTLPYSGTFTLAGGSILETTIVFTQIFYAVVFSETGLPSGTTWGVTYNGVLAFTTSQSLSISSPNGTYSYAIAVVPGYVQATLPSSGTITVSGSSLTEPTLQFVKVLFPVTFSESGLPGGTTWGVTINGTLYTTTAGNTISSSLPNGTYSYVISNVPGYRQSTLAYSGSVTINGVAVVEPTLAFSVTTYTVTFAETGLPSGTTWSITLGGTQTFSVTSSIVFTVANGTYAYSIADISGWHQRTLPYSGSIVVNGATITEPTLSYAAFTYSVTFNEVGLASGTSWTVSVAGTPYVATAPSAIVAQAVNGTFSYSVSGVPGYTQSSLAWNGTGVVNAGPVTMTTISWTVFTWAVTFNERGLGAGVSWSVTVAGTQYSAVALSPIVAQVANGTWSYTISDVSGWHQTTLPYSGTLTVAGAALTEPTLQFVRVTYTATVAETGLTGELWGVTVNGTLYTTRSTSLGITLPNGTWTYTVSTVAGWHLNAGNFYSGVFAVAGSSAVVVTLPWSQVVYAVTVTSVGLTGEQWAATFNGTFSGYTNATSITFYAPNGTWRLNLSNVPGWRASFYAANEPVNGAPLSVTVHWTPNTYAVTFDESGLSSGTSWAITFNGSTVSSTASSIVFQSVNGTWPYSVANVPGWRASSYSGTVAVAAAAPSPITVTFSRVTYAVMFSESGLATGSAWSFTLANVTHITTMRSIVVYLANGSYAFSVPSQYGMVPTPVAGTIVVNGAGVNQQISFSAGYSVTFQESGLATGTSWGVNANGESGSSTTRNVTLLLGNGTYSYSLIPVPGYVTTWTGSVTVSGAAKTVSITFTVYLIAVTFHETGLSTGTQWNVTLNGVTQRVTTPTMTFNEANGSYTYTVGAIASYTTSYHGSVAVAGAPVSVTIAWTNVTYTVTFTSSGLPAGRTWGVTFNGVTQHSTASSVSYVVKNGTYAYNVSNVPNWRISGSYSGSIHVAGSSPTPTALTFSETPYTLTFSESGLPSGTAWSVTVLNVTHTFVGASFSVTVHNASGYNYTIGQVSGYTANPSSGVVNINGASVTVSIVFTAVPAHALSTPLLNPSLLSTLLGPRAVLNLLLESKAPLSSAAKATEARTISRSL